MRFIKSMTDTKASKYLLREFNDPRAGLLLIKLSLDIDKGNLITGTPASLAKRYNISVRNFIFGVKVLKQVDLIRKYSKQEYMLNPKIEYIGDDKRLWLLEHIWDTQTTSGLHGKIIPIKT